MDSISQFFHSKQSFFFVGFILKNPSICDEEKKTRKRVNYNIVSIFGPIRRLSRYIFQDIELLQIWLYFRTHTHTHTFNLFALQNVDHSSL